MGTEKAEQAMATFKWGKIDVPDPDDPATTIEVDEDDTMFDVLVQKFTDYYIPRRNLIHDRSIFNQRVQMDGETVEEFVRELQSLVKYCHYSDTDDQIRDRLVIGLRDSRVKEKLQLVSDLSLDKAITIARREEMIKEQMKLQERMKNEAVAVNELRD